jgi:hypothetical protein
MTRRALNLLCPCDEEGARAETSLFYHFSILFDLSKSNFEVLLSLLQSLVFVGESKQEERAVPWWWWRMVVKRGRTEKEKTT